MTGRGGRRGKDKKGNAYYLFNLFDIKNDVPSAVTLKNMISGNPDKLTSKLKINFNLILKLVSIGYSFVEMVDYINNSMIKDEIDAELEMTVKKIKEIEMEMIKSENSLKYLRTNVDIIRDYSEKLEKLELVSGKKKKKLSRDIDFIEYDNKFIKNDYEKWLKPNILKKELVSLEKTKFNMEHYVSDEIYIYLKILNETNFIKCNLLKETMCVKDIEILQKGKVYEIQEINSLPFTEYLIESELFKNMNPLEILCILSIFIPYKASDEIKVYDIYNLREKGISEKILDGMKKINNIFDKFYDIETKYQTNFTENYDIQFDLCEIMYEWGMSNDEMSCKKILLELEKKNKFFGNFIKFILKINNMVNELEKICIIEENLELLSKIKEIPNLTLKSIVTKDSLYLETL